MLQQYYRRPHSKYLYCIIHQKRKNCYCKWEKILGQMDWLNSRWKSFKRKKNHEEWGQGLIEKRIKKRRISTNKYKYRSNLVLISEIFTQIKKVNKLIKKNNFICVKNSEIWFFKNNYYLIHKIKQKYLV